MAKFDYKAPAEFYPARSRVGHRPVGYRRFDTAAHAIRYAIEEMPVEFLDGTVLEIDSERVDGAQHCTAAATIRWPESRAEWVRRC